MQNVKKPLGIKSDLNGNVYVISTEDNKVLKITPNGKVSTVNIGTDINAAQDLAVSEDGTLYIADTDNKRILKVEIDGNATTFAGKKGVSGLKDGLGEEAHFNKPTNIRIASDGFLWVVNGDEDKKLGQTVRRITKKGQVNTYYFQKNKSSIILDFATAKRDKNFNKSLIVNLFLIYQNNTISNLGTNGIETILTKVQKPALRMVNFNLHAFLHQAGSLSIVAIFTL